MFGTESCKFCKTSKETLDKYKCEYNYVNLSLLYGETWRQVFQDLAPLLNGQRTIPIILYQRSDTDTDFTAPLTPDKLSAWTILGSYNELLRYLDQIIDIDADADF